MTRNIPVISARNAGLLTLFLILSACQGERASLQDTVSVPGDDSALSTMERVAVAAQKCWFAGKDPACKGLRLSPELKTYAGKPRILAVPSKNIGGLPLLVVEAAGKPAKLTAYGPMMDGEHAARIGADVLRWAARDPSCKAGA
jgi:hypothetical protein